MSEVSRKSTNIAIGGVFSALCLLTMFLSSAVPLSSYIMPALAGVMLTVVVIENGNKVAMMVYVSVSLLSIFIVPDYEVKALFISFFGYYPIVKFKLEKINFKPLAYLLKLALFTTAISSTYYVLMNILGIPGLKEEFGEFGEIALVGLLSLGIVAFLIYDFSLARYILFYKYRIRKLIARQ